MNFWASDIPLLLVSLIKSQSPEKEDPIDQHRDTNTSWLFQEMEERQ